MERLPQPSQTALFLLILHQQVLIPLQDIAGPYLGLSVGEAKRNAATGQLPFPVIRAGTQKSPWMVHVLDLAAVIDRRRAAAHDHLRELELAGVVNHGSRSNFSGD